jgi:dipeptidyl aminopeptidase/acylaminoacyl peptidase
MNAAKGTCAMSNFRNVILLSILAGLVFMAGCSRHSASNANNANTAAASPDGNATSSDGQAGEGKSFDIAPGAKSIAFADLPVGSSCLITQDSHDSWVAWSPDDSQLAFISAISGRDNLYLMKIADMKLLESREPGLYVAEYLTRPQGRSDYYIQKTSSNDYGIEGPEWSPDGKNILLHTYQCPADPSDDSDCKDYQLFVYNLANSSSKTVFKSDSALTLHCWLNNNVILFAVEGDDQKIYQLDLNTSKRDVLFDSEKKIEGFAVDKGDLLIATEDAIGTMNLATKAVKWDQLPAQFNGTQIGRSGRKFILTAGEDDPAAGWYDLDTQATDLFMNSYDYEPTISNSKKDVAFISEGLNGIVIKRLQ